MQKLSKVAPTEVRYIKLGRGGAWARSSFENGWIAFSHKEAPHELALAGDWDAVRGQLAQDGARKPHKVSDFLREVQDFYTLGPDCLWITFAEGRLWWAFAEPEIEMFHGDPEAQGARRRRVIGEWRSADIEGEPLLIHDLSTKLTKTRTYRQTICRVEAAEYAVRVINAAEDPDVRAAKAARAAFVATLLPLIRSLHERDFELLVDLTFTRLGWERVSEVGGTQQDVDIVLEQPATKARAHVQVKSAADQAVLDDYADRLRAYDGAARFFVCHSPKGLLRPPDGDEDFHLWAGSELAAQVIEAGLVDWLLSRAA